MKSIFVVFAALMLTGCYQSVNQDDINRAVKVCGSVSNISAVYALFDGNEQVACYSGEHVRLDEVKGDKK